MTDRRKTRRWVKIALISFFSLLIVGYTSYEIQKVVFGPKIYISTPGNGSLISESLVNVSGKTQNVNDISMDDRKIFVDEKGNFNEQVLLSYGYNLLTMKASDKFGRKIEKTIEVVYK
jgi:hypothetical protein